MQWVTYSCIFLLHGSFLSQPDSIKDSANFPTALLSELSLSFMPIEIRACSQIQAFVLLPLIFVISLECKTFTDIVVRNKIIQPPLARLPHLVLLTWRLQVGSDEFDSMTARSRFLVLRQINGDKYRACR